jgi:hypothetical protein
MSLFVYALDAQYCMSVSSMEVENQFNDLKSAVIQDDDANVDNGLETVIYDVPAYRT